MFGLTGEPTSTVHPIALNTLPLGWLHEYQLSELQPIIDAASGHGYSPLPGEPGSVSWDQLYGRIEANSHLAETARANPDTVRVRIGAAADQMRAAQAGAADAVLRSMYMAFAGMPTDEPRLGSLAVEFNGWMMLHPNPFPNTLPEWPPAASIRPTTS